MRRSTGEEHDGKTSRRPVGIRGGEGERIIRSSLRRLFDVTAMAAGTVVAVETVGVGAMEAGAEVIEVGTSRAVVAMMSSSEFIPDIAAPRLHAISELLYALCEYLTRHLHATLDLI